MGTRFSDDFLKALEFSRDEAVRTGWRNISPDHIMLGILRQADNEACRALEALGLDTAMFKECIDEAVFCPEAIAWNERDTIFPGDPAQSLLRHAALEAARCKDEEICTLHYLLACCRVAGSYSHDWLAEHGAELRPLVEASGRKWSCYGLGTGDGQAQPAAAGPDAKLLADAIEQRLREGYSTDNPLAS